MTELKVFVKAWMRVSVPSCGLEDPASEKHQGSKRGGGGVQGLAERCFSHLAEHRQSKRQRPEYRGNGAKMTAASSFLYSFTDGREAASATYGNTDSFQGLAYEVPKTIKRGRAQNHYLITLDLHRPISHTAR